LAANYDRKHLENSIIGLENLWSFFLPKECEDCNSGVIFMDYIVEIWKHRACFCWIYCSHTRSH